MSEGAVIREIDELGRVTLPADIRRLLGLVHGSELDIYVDGEKIVLVPKS